jgi:hypothetical protein
MTNPTPEEVLDAGDLAVAAGWHTNDGTGPASDLDAWGNYGLDRVAAERTARINADAGKVDKPGDGAGMARIEPGSSHSIGFYTISDSTLYFRPATGTGVFDRKVITQQELTAAIEAIPDVDVSGKFDKSGGTITGDVQVNGRIRTPGAVAGGSGVIAYVQNSNSEITRGVSARRFKKNVRQLDPLALGEIAQPLVDYQMKVAYDRSETRFTGHIADDMIGTPAERFVVYDENGDVLGFDQIAYLLAMVAQLSARVDVLEGRA